MGKVRTKRRKLIKRNKRYTKKRYTKKRYTKKRYTKKRYTKKRYTKNKIKGGRITRKRDTLRKFLIESKIKIDVQENDTRWRPLPIQHKFFQFMGLREISMSISGENEPYQDGFIVDSEDLYNHKKIGNTSSYVNRCRSFLKRITNTRVGRNLVDTSLISELVNISYIEPIDPPRSTSFGGGQSGGVDPTTVGLGLLGASTVGKAFLEARYSFKDPTLFRDILNKNPDTYFEKLEQQIKECNELREGKSVDKSKDAVIFGSHHQFRKMLGMKKYDNSKKYGIPNNGMIIFQKNTVGGGPRVIPALPLKLTCLVPPTLEEKDLSDFDYISDRYNERTSFKSIEKGTYEYIKDTTSTAHMYHIFELDSLTRISKLMFDCDLDSLSFCRHGTAIHTLLGTSDKNINTLGRLACRNSRLLPGEMVDGGPVVLQGARLYDVLKISSSNILWINSELVRTMQTCITSRCGYILRELRELDDQQIERAQKIILTKAYKNIKKARVYCLLHSLDISGYIRDLYNKNTKRSRSLMDDLQILPGVLMESIIVINKFDKIYKGLVPGAKQLDLINQLKMVQISNNDFTGGPPASASQDPLQGLSATGFPQGETTFTFGKESAPLHESAGAGTLEPFDPAPVTEESITEKLKNIKEYLYPKQGDFTGPSTVDYGESSDNPSNLQGNPSNLSGDSSFKQEGFSTLTSEDIEESSSGPKKSWWRKSKPEEEPSSSGPKSKKSRFKRETHAPYTLASSQVEQILSQIRELNVKSNLTQKETAERKRLYDLWHGSTNFKDESKNWG